MKILIFGASGFLGRKLFNDLSKKNKVIGTCNSQEKYKDLLKIDAIKDGDLEDFIKKNVPDLIINTISLSSSVLCEKDFSLAEIINYHTNKNIAKVCKKKKIPLVFISSSYVFDGIKGNYSEEDRTSPQNNYGITKVKAEKEVLDLNKGIVLRVDLLYGYNSFEDKNGLLGNIISNNKIYLGNPNQIRSPLLIDDLPEIIEYLIMNNKEGIFHVAGPDKISMSDFVKKLRQAIGSDLEIVHLEKKELLVKPLKDSSLNINKINSLGIKTKNIGEGLKIIKNQIKSENS